MLSADEKLPKRTLKGDYTEVYHQTPKETDSISKMFQEGMFYGRIRSNTFFYRWERENASQTNYVVSGLGGSLLYQSALFKGFDLKAGLYYSRAYFDVADEDISKIKAANSTFSRFDYTNTGAKDMAVLGQAYIRYSGIKESEVRIGRQLVETFFTKSNDISMIPNTFDALLLSTKAIDKTMITLAYLNKEKLRGHSQTSSILMYGDANSTSANNPQWSQNDDNAMHKGLSYSALKAAGKPIDSPLLILDTHNRSLDALKLDASYYSVPELVSQLMLEENFKINVSKGLSLTTGIRYTRQFDDGAGVAGGAAIDATPNGYTRPDSVDSQMGCVKAILKYKDSSLKIAYSQVADEADLIAPWRGYPTGGYTFSLTRVNWLTNQRSTQIELKINQNPTGIYQKVLMRFYATHTDSDESKGHYDENYYYAGLVQNLPFMQDLQWRLRVGYLDTMKEDADGLDTRIELNYLF